MSYRLVRNSALALVVVAIASTLAASMWSRPGLPLVRGHTSDLQPNEHTLDRVSAFRPFIVSKHSSDGPNYSVKVMVVADEEFVDRVGIGWRDAARDVANSASDLLEEVGVGVDVVGVARWISYDGTSEITYLLDDVVEQMDHHGEYVLLALTGQKTDTYDGWARTGPPVLLLRITTMPPPRTTASLFAHELGHILGASHHDDDHACTENGCLMDEVGYAHADTWCDHHKEEIARTLSSI